MNVPNIGGEKLAENLAQAGQAVAISGATPLQITPEEKPMDDRGKMDEVREENEEIYSIKNFGV